MTDDIVRDARGVWVDYALLERLLNGRPVLVQSDPDLYFHPPKSFEDGNNIGNLKLMAEASEDPAFVDAVAEPWEVDDE